MRFRIFYRERRRALRLVRWLEDALEVGAQRRVHERAADLGGPGRQRAVQGCYFWVGTGPRRVEYRAADRRASI